MNIVQCTNGHFYDSEKYSHCPQCKTNASAGEPHKESVKHFAGRRNGVFAKANKLKVNRIKTVKLPQTQETRTENPTLQNASTVAMGIDGKRWRNTKTERVQQETNTDTILAEQQAAVQALHKRSSFRTAENPPEKDAVGEVKQSPFAQDRENGIRRVIPEQKNSGETETVPLTDDNKTVGYFGVIPPQEMRKPIKPAMEPPVGWVVCVQGSSMYRVYPLYAGNNSIGRDRSNRVCVAEDSQISRSRHAIITYEPKKRFFIISPGNGSGLTYLNNKLITGARKLKHRDLIEIGQTRFIFIPLCDKYFSWDAYQRR